MAEQPIRLLIVDDIQSTRDNLRKLLSFEDDIQVVGTAGDGKEGVEEAERLRPDIVLTDVNMPLMDGIQLTEQLTQDLPSSPVIIMSVQGERDYLRRAMQAGAREFLIKPFSHDELVAAIRRVYALEQKKGTFLARGADAPPVPASGRTGPGEVFVVFSAKGGVGKSIIAANLAVALARETDARVALVDLDLQFGDIGVMLNLNHSRSITDVVDAQDHLDAEILDDILAVGPAGVRVLLAPIKPELADLVTPDHVRTVFAEVRKVCDFVVVDASSHLGEAILQVMEMATRILVVTGLTIPSVKNARLTLGVLESLNIDPERVLLIVNRVDGYSDFNKEATEQYLRVPVMVQIPHDPKAVADAWNQGKPFVETQPEAEISRAIRELVFRLVPQEQAALAGGDKKRKRGIFGR
ncbi:MAG: CpaE family protein [Candidatus Dormibacteria bacterium]